MSTEPVFPLHKRANGVRPLTRETVSIDDEANLADCREAITWLAGRVGMTAITNDGAGDYLVKVREHHQQDATGKKYTVVTMTMEKMEGKE